MQWPEASALAGAHGEGHDFIPALKWDTCNGFCGYSSTFAGFNIQRDLGLDPSGASKTVNSPE